MSLSGKLDQIGRMGKNNYKSGIDKKEESQNKGERKVIKFRCGTEILNFVTSKELGN